MELSLWVSIITMAIGVICNIVFGIFIFGKNIAKISSSLVLILIVMIDMQFILGIAFFIYNLVA